MAITDLEPQDTSSSIERLYLDQITRNSTGPQVEGLLVDDLMRAHADPDTLYLATDQGDLPVVVSNAHDSTTNQPYYVDRFPDGNVFRFMPVPLSAKQLSSLRIDLTSLMDTETDDNRPVTMIVMREESNSSPVDALTRIATENGLAINEIPLFDSRNNTEASVIHFTGLPELDFETLPKGAGVHETFYRLVNEGVYELYPENGSTVLRPEALTPEIKDHIWDIYNKQLDILIEQHPAYQRLTRDELDHFLEDESGFNIVHIVDGEVATLFLGVTDLDSSPWLRKEEIVDKYPEEVMYCPAMVTDFKKQGHQYAKNIFSVLMTIVKERRQNLRPYIECTNISAGYIPDKVVEPAVAATGQGTLRMIPVAKYVYEAFELHKT